MENTIIGAWKASSTDSKFYPINDWNMMHQSEKNRINLYIVDYIYKKNKKNGKSNEH